MTGVSASPTALVELRSEPVPVSAIRRPSTDAAKPWDYLGPKHQRQLDADGVFVGVSRQALDETLEHFETLTAALEDFDNWFCGFDPNDQASRMVGRKILIRARAAVARVRNSTPINSVAST